MYKNIIMATILIVAFTSTVHSSIIDLDYTDGFRTVNETLTETTHINVPSGNIIDSIIYKPTFLSGIAGDYNIYNKYYINDILYEDSFESEIETSIFHIFSTKYIYNVRHEMDGELVYHKEYETYINKYCWFPIKISSYFGSHSQQDENKITIESEIFGNTGIKRSTDVFSVYDAKGYAASNYTISYSGMSELDVILTNKVVGIHTVDYYVGQLNPTLKYTYKLGFSWLDKELYILNAFMITDKVLVILMFWMSILANSFIPIIFILLVFVIPLAALFNSKGRTGFISKMVLYYTLVFNIALDFIRYSVLMIMRVLMIIRSLIPWI